MQPVISVVGVLIRFSVEPPGIAGFHHAGWSGTFNHGQRYTRESFSF